jgi:uncharacterized membrane protein
VTARFASSACAALFAAAAAVASAQARPTPPQPAPALRDPAGGVGLGTLGMGLGALSPDGRATVTAALREARDPETRAAIQVARARILQLMAADRFDASAFERALADERALALRQQERAHRMLLATVQKLSAADRKALADAGLRARERAEGARARLVERWRERQRAAPPAP